MNGERGSRETPLFFHALFHALISAQMQPVKAASVSAGIAPG